MVPQPGRPALLWCLSPSPLGINVPFSGSASGWVKKLSGNYTTSFPALANNSVGSGALG